MTEHRTTTAFASKEDNAELILGTEWYETVGDFIDREDINEIFESYAGLTRHWHCLEKTKRAADIIGEGLVCIGSLMVRSSDNKSEYGYYYNPPYEFHAWLLLMQRVTETHGNLVIFDAALPGVIEKGLVTCDEIGPSLVGRKPVILNGKPKEWMRYDTCEIYLPEQLKEAGF